MVALRDRARMADVLAEYDDLVRQGIEIPGYALVAVADAHLYFHQPEKARDLYLRGLAVDPNNPVTQLALFYAYVDLEDFDAAYREADTAAANQAIWLYLKGLNDPIENPDRATADLAAAYARFYADQLAEAYRRISAMAEAAPNNTRYLSALANIESARGWPRLAAEEYDISRALTPHNVTTEAGQATNNLDLRDYHLAESEAADLTQRFPENLEVQRLDRLLQVQNMAEVRLTVEPTLSSPTNVQGGSGIAVDGQIYSPPIDYNWRLFATEHVANEQLPEGEGTINLRRSGIGVEYRGPDLVASLEGTINAFGPKLDTTLVTGLGSGRAGISAQANWSLNDYWSIGGGAELFALDTPLRALAAGITANAYSTNVEYRESESRNVMLGGEVMNFSDGNLRTSVTGEFTQRLLTTPHLTMDAIVGLAASQNSANDNRPYFNPRRDALATVGLSIRQVIYRRYQFVYDHHLVLTPGVYWQQGFGAGGAASILYEHRIQVNDVFEAGLGVTVSRQQYDGQYQNTVGVMLNLRMRF
jgi:biofilm PGA synthesis protein PgaA